MCLTEESSENKLKFYITVYILTIIPFDKFRNNRFGRMPDFCVFDLGLIPEQTCIFFAVKILISYYQVTNKKIYNYLT